MQALESLTDSQVRKEITWEIAKTGKHAHIGPRTQNTKRIYTLRIIIFKKICILFNCALRFTHERFIYDKIFC